MKRTTSLIALGLLLPLAAQADTATAAPAATPAAAPAPASPDLRYRHDPVKDLEMLKDYDGEPWYGMLANCAGYYTAAAETPGVPESVSNALRKQANFYATVASFRLARDRGLEKTIHDPVVTIADKASANAKARGLVSTPQRQESMRTLCGGHLNAYERMVPGMELQ